MRIIIARIKYLIIWAYLKIYYIEVLSLYASVSWDASYTWFTNKWGLISFLIANIWYGYIFNFQVHKNQINKLGFFFINIQEQQLRIDTNFITKTLLYISSNSIYYLYYTSVYNMCSYARQNRPILYHSTIYRLYRSTFF